MAGNQSAEGGGDSQHSQCIPDNTTESERWTTQNRFSLMTIPGKIGHSSSSQSRVFPESTELEIMISSFNLPPPTGAQRRCECKNLFFRKRNNTSLSLLKRKDTDRHHWGRRPRDVGSPKMNNIGNRSIWAAHSEKNCQFWSGFFERKQVINRCT